MEEPIIYDSYNGRIKADQSTVGTLTTNCGNDAERNGVKIIEPLTTSGQPIASTIRASIHKQGARNLMENFLNGRGYEGVIEPTERFFKQAFETAEENHCQDGDIIDAYNKKVAKDGITPTVTTRPEGFKTAILPIQNYRIRKLTPKECWRLMDFTDKDFYYAAYGREVPVELAKRVELRNLTKAEWKVLWRYERHQQVSNSQLYKQAGNSIVVAVLEAIFSKML